MNLTIYSLTYNEQFLLPFVLDFYRSRFPNAQFIIFDNGSTDDTVTIAQKNGCQVIDYSFRSGGTLNDRLHMEIKNNCWKTANTDWVIVSDLDELVDINEEQLKKEEELGTTRVKTIGYQMVNMEDNLDVANMKWASRSDRYDKSVLFNKKHIQDINYDAGAHTCHPVGNVVDSQEAYKLYHYKFINAEMLWNKSLATRERLSEANKQNGWGLAQVSRTKEEVFAEFIDERKKAVKIL